VMVWNGWQDKETNQEMGIHILIGDHLLQAEDHVLAYCISHIMQRSRDAVSKPHCILDDDGGGDKETRGNFRGSTHLGYIHPHSWAISTTIIPRAFINHT